MSWRGRGSAIGLAILATVAIVSSERVAAAPGLRVAQATQPADAGAKPVKSKAKPKKKDTTTTTTSSRVGPPDPGKY
jgi:hypothetical protein